MQPKAFKAWHASLPPHLQAYARHLYDVGKQQANHTASSLDLIKQLVSDKAAAELNPIFRSFTHD